MARKTPDWLSYDADGNATVTLQRGIKLDGATVTAMRLREPTVADQLVASASGKGDDAAEEIALLANLGEVTPADIESATLRDYRRLQVALAGFID